MFSIKLLAWKKPVSLKVYFTTVPACAWVAVIFQITLSLTMSAGLPRKYSVTVSNGPLGASLRGSSEWKKLHNGTLSSSTVNYTWENNGGACYITCWSRQNLQSFVKGKNGNVITPTVARYWQHDDDPYWSILYTNIPSGASYFLSGNAESLAIYCLD